MSKSVFCKKLDLFRTSMAWDIYSLKRPVKENQLCNKKKCAIICLFPFLYILLLFISYLFEVLKLFYVVTSKLKILFMLQYCGWYTKPGRRTGFTQKLNATLVAQSPISQHTHLEINIVATIPNWSFTRRAAWYLWQQEPFKIKMDVMGKSKKEITRNNGLKQFQTNKLYCNKYLVWKHGITVRNFASRRQN